MRLSEIQIGISLLTVLFTGITIVLLYLLNEDHTNILTSRKKIDEAHSDFLRLYTKDEYFSKRDLIKWINQWNHLSSVITLVDEYTDILEKFLRTRLTAKNANLAART